MYLHNSFKILSCFNEDKIVSLVKMFLKCISFLKIYCSFIIVHFNIIIFLSRHLKNQHSHELVVETKKLWFQNPHCETIFYLSWIKAYSEQNLWKALTWNYCMRSVLKIRGLSVRLNYTIQNRIMYVLSVDEDQNKKDSKLLIVWYRFHINFKLSLKLGMLF